MFEGLNYSAVYFPNILSINYVEEKKHYIVSDKPEISVEDAAFALVSLKIEPIENKEGFYFATPIIRSVDTRSMARLFGLSAAFRTMLVKSLSVQAGKCLYSLEDNRTLGYEIHLPRVTVPYVKKNKDIIDYIKEDLEALILQGINLMWAKNVNEKKPK